MNLYLSGAACRAVFVDGTATYYVNLDRPTELISFGDENLSIASISRILGESHDIRTLSVQNVEEGLQLLLSDCNKDSALRLFDIASNFQNSLCLATDAIEVLEPLLQVEEVFSFVRNYAFAIPIDASRGSARPPESWKRFPEGSNLLNLMLSAQPYIRAIRSAWEEVAKAHFETRSSMYHGEKTFVDCGTFYSIYETMMGDKRRDDLTMDLLIEGGSVYRCREITKAWFDALDLEQQRNSERLDIHFQAISTAEVKSNSYETNADTISLSDREKYLRVKGEQSAIIDRLRRRDLRNAERFTERLVIRQVGRRRCGIRSKDPMFAVARGETVRRNVSSAEMGGKSHRGLS